MAGVASACCLQGKNNTFSMFASILGVASACCLQGKNNCGIGLLPKPSVASACCLQGTNNLLTSKGMELGEVKMEGGTRLLRGEKR